MKLEKCNIEHDRMLFAMFRFKLKYFKSLKLNRIQYIDILILLNSKTYNLFLS